MTDAERVARIRALIDLWTSDIGTPTPDAMLHALRRVLTESTP